MIYFDNAATTRAMPEAVEKMAHMLCEEYGNPASVSSMGLAVEKEIKKAADTICKTVWEDGIYYEFCRMNLV